MPKVGMERAQLAVSLDNHWRMLLGLLHDATRYQCPTAVLDLISAARTACGQAAERLLTAEDSDV